MKIVEFVVYSSIDQQEFGSFKTLKEARQHIKELKRFDEENGNPFDEGYYIEREVYDY